MGVNAGNDFFGGLGHRYVGDYLAFNDGAVTDCCGASQRRGSRLWKLGFEFSLSRLSSFLIGYSLGLLERRNICFPLEPVFFRVRCWSRGRRILSVRNRDLRVAEGEAHCHNQQCDYDEKHVALMLDFFRVHISPLSSL